MSDEFQAGVCAENWWMMSTSQSNYGSSSLSSTINNNMEIFSWPSDFDTKVAGASDESGSADSERSMIFQEPINQDSLGGALSMNLSSTIITTDWNQTLVHDSKRNGSNCDENINSSSNYQQDASTIDYSQIRKNWSLENFSTIDEDSSMDTYKGPLNQGFPVSSSSYGYPSSLIQTLFDTDSDQDSVFGNQPMDYPAVKNICPKKLNEFSSSSFLNSKSLVLPKQQPLVSHLPLPNNSSWNTSGDGLLSPVPSQFLSPTFEDKPNCPNPSSKTNNQRIRELSTVAKNNSNSTEPVFKRTRIETPSPLPTFKVRKEKLGDRVTALQQVVSPFGKTDTASVLHEAIEYIKLLHDQVTVLITPYMKGGSPFQHEQTLRDSKGVDQGVMINRELRSRGLCLVPISSTFPVAAEATADFWTPTFGGSFR